MQARAERGTAQGRGNVQNPYSSAVARLALVTYVCARSQAKAKKEAKPKAVKAPKEPKAPKAKAEPKKRKTTAAEGKAKKPKKDKGVRTPVQSAFVVRSASGAAQRARCLCWVV